MPTVKDFMTKNVITIDAGKTVIEAADLMQACWNCFSARTPFPSSSTTNYLNDRLFAFVTTSSFDQIPLASADANTPDLRCLVTYKENFSQHELSVEQSKGVVLGCNNG